VRRVTRGSARVDARVTVAWTPTNDAGAPNVTPTEIELVSEPDAEPNRTWVCPQSFGSNWVEAISSAHCREVVLTARLGNNLPAKHLVLELAELLTFRLAESQPLIRVRFLPTIDAVHGERSHA
jgi:hypothetical protein